MLNDNQIAALFCIDWNQPDRTCPDDVHHRTITALRNRGFVLTMDDHIYLTRKAQEYLDGASDKELEVNKEVEHWELDRVLGDIEASHALVDSQIVDSQSDFDFDNDKIW